ncbi:DUF2637 domain-containing protein [Streptomyces sp. DSM 41982]|uniref:DUF2637 domain-containing protein n=1 Tax=Streptomyces evansiae TaxID=3075535 RepID=A0ABD5E8U6_9ACTN|nr:MULTISPECIES: DUF2637 domain-containing protein [unclassified Streptomyces]MDT0417824.1 DUF2637 domain-containing protein [Streptomyces sp. DSM 41982]SCE11250.1 hypothetical protein GA0115246_1109011 [Streptomyces sp. SolWspMP-sol7th]
MNSVHASARSVHVRSAERALSVGTWLIVSGAMLYSVLTVTPLMADHTASSWRWTAPILPLVVDAAVVIVVRLDSVLARLGGQGGRWPVVLRWMTGAMTLALNTTASALAKDLVGVAVHAVAPLLLIVTAETGLAYRRAITRALDDLDQRQAAEREQAAQRAREDAERRAREREEREEREERRRREEREHAAQLAREQREHEAALAREQAEREERRAAEEARREMERTAAERAEHERREREREHQERAREQAAREAREKAERERRETALREQEEQRHEHERRARERAALLDAAPVSEKLGEDEARRVVSAAFDVGLSVREAASACGWSVGWVSSRYAEHRDSKAVAA